MNPEVTEYIEKLDKPWQVAICTSARAAAHRAIPELGERIMYGKPHFSKDGNHIFIIGAAKA